MTRSTHNRGARGRGLACALGVMLIGCGTAAHASLIEFSAVNLADTTAGEDLWQYNYRLSGTSFLAGTGFFTEFDYGSYTKLQDPPGLVSADWSPLVAQPDIGLPGNGFFDVQALVDNASLKTVFSVSFVWLGAGTPGAQSYTLYDANYQALEVGSTQPVALVPIPAAAVLLGSGLIALLGVGRRCSERMWHSAVRGLRRRGLGSQAALPPKGSAQETEISAR